VSPGYDRCPSVSSVVPVFTLARTKVSIDAAELSGMAARRMRPDRVSRYFARFRLGFAWLVPRSITSTAPAMRIFPDLAGSKKLLSARKGISAWSTSTTPSSGSRWGSIIDRRSFCASNQAVLYVMPSCDANWSADMPFEWVAMRCAAQAAGGTDKPLRPTPLEQKRRTARLVGKTRLEFAQRSCPCHWAPPRACRVWLAARLLYIIWGSLGQRDKPSAGYRCLGHR